MDDIEGIAIPAAALEAIMAGAKGKRKQGPSVLPEAKIELLREAAARYNEPNAFKVGDLVKPRKESWYNTEGPLLVIESGDKNLASGSVEFGAFMDGLVSNVRVLAWREGNVIPYLMSHWMLEHWFPE